MKEPELVDINRASRITGLAPSTLYKLARRHQLRSFKVLGALRFDRADLVALIVERPSCVEKGAGYAPDA